jgi:hypothetical protein
MSPGTGPTDAQARLLGLLAASDGDGAFSLLARWRRPLDWSAMPSTLTLTDGASLSFDRRRRSAVLASRGGGSTVFDLGRPDRMRTAEQILTPDLTVEEGPTFELTVKAPWSGESGEVAARDPLDRRSHKVPMFLTAGERRTSRLLDATGRPRLLVVGDLDGVTGFGTFLMDDGAAYAHLRTASGLGCFYDGRRSGFMGAVTPEAVDQARTTGFAPVLTRAGCIGVLLDCGEPGDYLALVAYHRDGGAVAIVVDLRRPPVKDGAIVDPPLP